MNDNCEILALNGLTGECLTTDDADLEARRIPKTSTKDLTRPGAGSNPTTRKKSKGLNPS